MKRKNLPSVLLVTMAFLSCTCSDKGTADDDFDPPEVVDSVTVTVNRSEKMQTIDGFGFFGAQTVWWESNVSKLYSDAWADQVINDLGITIWRNEYYPPATDGQIQDADWEKQKPVVQGLAQTAKANHVPLKFIFTVWSPPADLKCALDENNQPLSGVPHTRGTKKGGTLDPAKYASFGNWLAEGVDLYKELGIDVYAISPQNEPLFKQDYNSCYYNPNKWYNEMLKTSIPVMKNKYPDVKVFGAENMLEMEGGDDRQWFYNRSLVNDPAALEQLDFWAVHGYQEGISPTTGAKLRGLWRTVQDEYVQPANKPVWMTETSGYTDNWKTANGKAGALDLAADIQSALYDGKAAAWLWWQGSGESPDEYSLMAGATTLKKYFVSKHFYRFIRPGARMVGVTSEGDVTATAFEHTDMGSFTIVLINRSENDIKLRLDGANLPGEFDFYVTTSAASVNCKKGESTVRRDSVILPGSSVVTLVNGNVFE